MTTRWGRRAKPRHNNSVKRDTKDLDHTLIWQAPRPQDLAPGDGRFSG